MFFFRANEKIFETIVFISAIILITVSIFISIYDISIKQKAMESSQNLFIESWKDKIKNENKKISNLLEYDLKTGFSKQKNLTKERLYEAYSIIDSLYNKYRDYKSVDEIKKILLDTIRPLRYDDGSGFYFITDIKGLYILHPFNTQIENSSILDRKDIDGKKTYQDMINVVNAYGEGFISFKTNTPYIREDVFQNRSTTKISYIKIFEPFKWVIGTGFYIDDNLENNKNISLERLSKTDFIQEIEYTIFNSKKDLIFTSNTKEVMTKKLDQSILIGDIFNNLKLLSTYVPKFIEFKNKDDEIITNHTGYIVYNKDSDWFILTSFNNDKISNYINQNIKAQKDYSVSISFLSLMLFLIASLFLVFLYFSFKNDITKDIKTFKESIDGNKISEAKINNSIIKEFSTIYNNKIETEREYNKSLLQTLNTKDTLIKEINHRIKNNLQIISSLLNMQSRYAKEPAFMEMFKEAQYRIRAISNLHEKLYNTKDFDNNTFENYIKDIVNELIYSYGKQNKVNTEFSIEQIILDADTAVPCGLVINELISNSLKHAFTDGRKGTIRIRMSELTEGKYELIVADNGIGIPETINFEKPDSLGLFLINSLVKSQLHGDIILSKENGTKFSITIYKADYKERL